MNEIERQQTVVEGEVIDGVPMVWLIEKGEYEDRHVVAVAFGSEAIAERVASEYNATHPWRDEGDKAQVTNQVPVL